MKHIDNIYCINLKRRVDRWKSIDSQLKQLKLSVTRFGAVDGATIPDKVLNDVRVSRGELGCSLSHLGVLRHAKQKGYKQILILEDDAEIRKGFIKHVTRAIENLPEQWVMLYVGGGYVNNTIDNCAIHYNDSLYRCRNILTTTGYVVNINNYQLLINTIDKHMESIPVDEIYIKYIQHKHPVFMCKPRVVYQSSSYSDVVLGHRDYDNMKDADTLMTESYNRVRNQNPVHPISLLNNMRFDIVFKYVYARSILRSNNVEYYKSMYREHLELWNNCNEVTDDDKNCFKDFDNAFKTIISSIHKHGFDKSISQIPVYKNKYVLNGSHRLAAALACNTSVATTPGKIGADGQLKCDYTYFNKIGMSSDYMDYNASVYAGLNKNCYVVCLFASGLAKLSEIKNILNKHNIDIYYEKRIELSYSGMVNLVKELYLGEHWVGTIHNGFSGACNKARFVFGSGAKSGHMVALLVESTTSEQVTAAKQAIRNLVSPPVGGLKIDKHSVHINDTHDETVRISNILFNDNSIHFLQNSTYQYCSTFESNLSQYTRCLNESTDHTADYCISASSILTVYGLREGNDLDYIHIGTKLPSKNKNISSHNTHGKQYYNTPYADIIHDPRNYFYTRGVKFAAPHVVRQMKAKRGESKDAHDIKLLDTII